MSNQSEAVKKWREKTKLRIVDAFGGSCGICGYNRCTDALELHHLDPSKKSFSLGSLRASPIKWDIVVEELRKCVMLCANCHREHHDDILPIPDNINRFSETYSDYKAVEKSEFYDDCPICGKKKRLYSKTCSVECGNLIRQKIDWTKYDLYDMIHTKQMTRIEVAELLGCNPATITKRLKRIQK